MPKTITITSEKGGVGKSTLAMHLAGALSERGLLVALVDEDGRVGSSLRWAQRSDGQLGFTVCEPDNLKPKALKKLDALLIDTEGRPKRKELRELAQRSDLLLIPSGVSALELEATRSLLQFFEQEGHDLSRVRVVLTRVPSQGHAAQGAREDLRDAGVQVCNTLIRHYAAYQKAAEAGTLVNAVQGTRAALAWADVLALSREVL